MPRLPGAIQLALLLLAWGGPGIAGAAETRPLHPVYSSVRFQVGHGGLPLPPVVLIPFTFDAAPYGRVRPAEGAVVLQGTTPATTATALPSGRSLMIATSRLTAPAVPLTLRVAGLANSQAFQIYTAISVGWPGAAATFAAGGRTGPSTVSFCPGQQVTASFNPGCTDPAAGAPNGLLRYTKTANQFGGPAAARFGGEANVAIRGSGPAPCTIASGMCLVIFAYATPASTGVAGGPFGAAVTTYRPGPPAPGGLRFASITSAGFIFALTSPGLGTGFPNRLTSFGGPWTTGMLTLSVTNNVGPVPEIFMLAGSDARVSGLGNISLVAGAVSNRTLSGPNANRAWLNLSGARFGGQADWAFRASAPAPCIIASGMCLVLFAYTTPNTTGVAGGPFGTVYATVGVAPPPPGGLRFASITTGGAITNITSPGIGTGIPNPATSYGGPWTTGMLTLSVANNIGPVPEIFMLSGSDARVSGLGNISLVAGAVSNRTLWGPEANRAWLNLYVPEPGATLGSLVALVALVICHLGWLHCRRSGP